MSRILTPPMALLCDGTVVVNVREFFAEPVPDLLVLAPKIRGALFLGILATPRELKKATERLQHGHSEAAAFLVGSRKKPLLRR